MHKNVVQYLGYTLPLLNSTLLFPPKQQQKTHETDKKMNFCWSRETKCEQDTFSCHVQLCKSRESDTKFDQTLNHSSWTGMKRYDSTGPRIIALGRHSFDFYFWLWSMTNRKHWTQTVWLYRFQISYISTIHCTILNILSSSDKYANEKENPEQKTNKNQKFSLQISFIHMPLQHGN